MIRMLPDSESVLTPSSRYHVRDGRGEHVSAASAPSGDRAIQPAATHPPKYSTMVPDAASCAPGVVTAVPSASSSGVRTMGMVLVSPAGTETIVEGPATPSVVSSRTRTSTDVVPGLAATTDTRQPSPPPWGHSHIPDDARPVRDEAGCRVGANGAATTAATATSATTAARRARSTRRSLMPTPAASPRAPPPTRAP